LTIFLRKIGAFVRVFTGVPAFFHMWGSGMEIGLYILWTFSGSSDKIYQKKIVIFLKKGAAACRKMRFIIFGPKNSARTWKASAA
jgi:hypothetical protein